MNAFARYPPALQEAIVARLGWSELRPVQELASQAILDGHNALVLAPTAGGKTEAAMFPALAQLIEQPPSAVGMLYIAPIKALLNNQAERLGMYTEMVGLERFLWHGDVSPARKRAFCSQPAALLMTTPESLEVMLISPRVPTARLFADLRLVVVDEIHALAGSDRGAHLMAVLQRLGRLSRHDVQRVGLSATVGNAADILNWLQGSSQRPRSIIDPPRPPSAREIRVLLTPNGPSMGAQACSLVQGQKSLLFCQSRALSEEVAQRLRGQGSDVFVHHSSVSLAERQAAEERFHRGRDAVIVCTSTLELGIDVGDLDRVLQVNAPSTVSSFLQRMGRTGRRPGQRANTTFLCEDGVTVLQAAALVELARRGWVEKVAVQRRCWPVLVHQLLALTLQYGAIGAERCWEELAGVPDFSGIALGEFEELVEHMVGEEYLFRSAGLLSMGDEAERVFGRRNFMEMYSVFSTPQLYQVMDGNGKHVGSLEQNFVDKLVEGVSCFLLGGRAWVVDQVCHSQRELRAHRAPAGRKPEWGSMLPHFLSFEVCQEMAAILRDDRPLPYLDGALLEELRRETALGEVLVTFAGGAVNQTLKMGLLVLKGWSSRADNFRVRLEDSVDACELGEALRVLAEETFWQAPETRERLLANLPEYRLSKFQRALPRRFAMEMVFDYLLDVERTMALLGDMNNV